MPLGTSQHPFIQTQSHPRHTFRNHGHEHQAHCFSTAKALGGTLRQKLRHTCMVRQCIPAQASTEQTSSQQSDANDCVWVRQATYSDSTNVAALCSEAFGPLTFKGFPSVMQASAALQQQAQHEIVKDVDTQLRRALDAKQKARLEAREFRLNQTNSRMQAELRKLAGLPAERSESLSSWQRQALRRWRRGRQFICLMASVGEGSTQLAGCAVMSMAAPEALLPPPLPSGAPLRCCVSNLAVAEGYRRRGVATKLLRRCERIAQRWGHEEIWLRTELSNEAAVQLYQRFGFQEVSRDPSLFGLLGPFRRILFRKQLEKRSRPPEDKLLPGHSKGATYVWDVSNDQ